MTSQENRHEDRHEAHLAEAVAIARKNVEEGGSAYGAVVRSEQQTALDVYSTAGAGIAAASAGLYGAYLKNTAEDGSAVAAIGTNVGLLALARDGIRFAQTSADPPTTRTIPGVPGSIAIDSDTSLWFCVGGGTPGTWPSLGLK